MTLIIAMKESDDSLLIGADKMNIESGQLKVRVDTKLFKHPQWNIVWGCAGDKHIARHEFTPWLQSLDIGSDWRVFCNKVADKIAELNGEQRARMRKAGVEPDPSSVIACLLVGWINGEPQIVEFTNDGKIASYIEDGFQAIGIPGIAWGAYMATINVNAATELRFRNILTTTINLAINCGKGQTIFRVTKDAVQELS